MKDTETPIQEPEYAEFSNNFALQILNDYNAVDQNNIIRIIIERVVVHREEEIKDLKDKVDYLDGSLNVLKIEF